MTTCVVLCFLTTTVSSALGRVQVHSSTTRTWRVLRVHKTKDRAAYLTPAVLRYLWSSVCAGNPRPVWPPRLFSWHKGWPPPGTCRYFSCSEFACCRTSWRPGRKYKHKTQGTSLRSNEHTLQGVTGEAWAVDSNVQHMICSLLFSAWLPGTHQKKIGEAKLPGNGKGVAGLFLTSWRCLKSQKPRRNTSTKIQKTYFPSGLKCYLSITNGFCLFLNTMEADHTWFVLSKISSTVSVLGYMLK